METSFCCSGLASIFLLSQTTRATIIVYDKQSPLLSIIMLTSGLRQLSYFVIGGVGITVNLLIDQKIILYLLLHEIICMDDDGNFLVGMHFGGVTYLLVLSLSICTGVTFQ